MKKLEDTKEALDSEIIMEIEPFFKKLRETFAPNAKCIAVQEMSHYDIYTWRLLHYEGDKMEHQVLGLEGDEAEENADMKIVFDDSHPDRRLLIIYVLEGEHWRKYGGEERGYGSQAPRETKMRKGLQDYIEQLFGIQGVPHLQYLWADAYAPIRIAWRGN